jgi:antitoxin (DNA-binding transcriptional repressor) of toxin-antitoxin stability system
MIYVSKGVLKAKMLEYFRRVEQSGEELIVTSSNVPTLRVTAIRKGLPVEEVFSDLRGKARIGDKAMLPETAEWEA